ncbi:uncharacterized protein LOC117317973 isoform X2 [Pecten maximus]|uniref:uncharacterized protein LOC117317973 isoform X2 n=1 Tax=Pecten maximus TaxID=6579 RepID=UPI0014582858|nr:uncharacterized protein LOC117317973 isoform X2 [Pecten maximus]
MLYFAMLLVIPTVTPYSNVYHCVCNFGKGSLPVFAVNKRFFPRLLPGRCLRRHHESSEALVDVFLVSLSGQVGYINNNKGGQLFSTVCDAITGKHLSGATPILNTAHSSMYSPPQTDRPQRMNTAADSRTERDQLLQKKDLTCSSKLCIGCHCELGKFTQVVMGLVGKRTVCLPCNFCSVTCNSATTVQATPIPQTASTDTLDTGCSDAVDSCALFHSQTVCTEFADWSRQNCKKYCGMCPTSGYQKPTTGHWISFGKK